MNRHDQLREHVRFFCELGVEGVSQDRAWVTRPADTAMATKAVDQIRKELGDCTRCKLHETRSNIVYGVGDPSAELMFVGEAPGRDEDQQGVPFVGAAGKLLDSLLDSISLTRSEIFITNMVKCRPPDNRDPMPEEIHSCSKYLESQIAIVSPQIIVTLGRHAFGRFFPGESIMKARGKIRDYGELKIFPLLHPAAALYRRELKDVLAEDFLTLRNLLNDYGDSQHVSSNDSTEDEPEQLTMF